MSVKRKVTEDFKNSGEAWKSHPLAAGRVGNVLSQRRDWD
jgi:hypothetical protein